MALVKDSKCSVCGREYKWRIERPGDSHWDRWTNDDGNTLTNWFMTNNLCWDHAFEKMPERFKRLVKTARYEEEEASQS